MENKKTYLFTLDKNWFEALFEAVSELPMKFWAQTYINLWSIISEWEGGTETNDISIDTESIDKAILYLSDLPIKVAIKPLSMFQRLLEEIKKIDNEKDPK